MSQKVVFTGLGMVSPYGEGLDAFRQNLAEGVSAIRPLTRFQEPGYRHDEAAEILEFDPRTALGTRKLRVFDRTILLAMVASEFLVRDMGIVDEERNNKHYAPEEVAVILGTYGSLKSTLDFEAEVAQNPRHVVPSIFPNTIMNAAASYVAIRFDSRGLSTTISNGETSSLEAIGLAHSLLSNGHASFFMAGGVEEISEHFAILKQKKMDYHKRENPILGEGSCMVAMEREDAVKARDGEVLGELVTFSNLFCPDPARAFQGNLEAVHSAMGDTFSDIRHVYSAETSLLDEAGFFESEVVIHRLRDKLGYLCSATGAFQLAAALTNDQIKSGELVLLNNISPVGNAAALVIRKA